ncbi:WXG100 family type VII secretion target [Streptomyces sp. NPDC001568]|uniref:WXG100 family type VII secretion target n=1 Tax=Streptomyces sp. NPDC001568 TaxID=3364588 RepID=UPI0036A12AB7
MATDFEGRTHEQLLAMIASLDPEAVTARAARLSNAAAVIEEIGESLKRHRIGGWEGEAAHAFQDWANRAGNATLRLSEYGAEAGKWLTEAAQTMIEVRANTPPYDTAAAADLRSARDHHNDPDAQEAARTAHTKLNADHERAIQQLTKLAQSYETATTQLKRAEIPTFPPPPGVFIPKGYSGSDGLARSGGSLGQEIVVGPGTDSVAPTSPGVPPGRPGHPGLLSSAQDHVLPVPEVGRTWVGSGHDVGVHLDHAGALPERTTVAPSNSPGGVGTGPGGAGAAPVPTSLHVLPPSIGGYGVIGGTPTAGKPPGGGWGSPVGGSGPRPPRDTGVVGGRPLSPTAPNAGIPRGTVIGGEGAHSAGRGMGGGFGMPPSSPVTGVGRRPATESGGVVGGRQPSTANQPFTQGGSGLVRGGVGPGAVGGAMGHAGANVQPHGRRRNDQVGIRPDHLTEDEETWQSNRRVVPPVID